MGGDVGQLLFVAVDADGQLGPGLMQLLAGTERGEVLVLLAELVFETKQLFAEAFEPVTCCGEFGQVGSAAREDLAERP